MINKAKKIVEILIIVGGVVKTIIEAIDELQN